MAKSIEQQRDEIRTSIHGRRIGLTYDDYLAGPKDVVRAVTNATSATTGTALLPHGFHTVATTTNDTWQLTDPPQTGVQVSIATATTSTGTHTVSPVAATILSSNGVAGSAIALAALGDRITLTAISTSQWAVTSANGTATVSS